MVPEGWRIRSVGETGRVHAGRQRSPHFTEGELRPYLRVANVFDGKIDTSNVLTMAFSAGEYERYKLHDGDILLNEGQSLELVGRSAIYRGEPSECCFQNTLVRYRAGRETNTTFAWNLFHFCLHTGVFAGIATKTNSIAHLGVSRFAELKLRFPPLPEQEKIAKILSTWDAAIETTERLLTNAEVQKRALVQQLLTGKRRLKRYENNSWRSDRASVIFRPVSVRNRPSEPLLAVTQDLGAVPRDALDRRVAMPKGELTSYKLVEPGDFIISLRAFEGGIEWSSYRGLVSPAYTVIRMRDGDDARFYRHYFKSADFIGRLAVAVIGIRDGKQISYRDFERLKLPRPQPDEQSAIAEILDFAEREIATIRLKVGAIRAEKRALMQQLLTGKRRVRV